MKPVYTGIFFDERTYNELKALAPTLGKSIDYPHLTLEFKPNELLPNDIVGEEVVVLLTGEGNDGSNQGFEVMLTRELKKFYKNPSVPHITTSLDPVTGKAVNTGKLDFRPIQQKAIMGRVGYFTGKGVQFHN